MCTLGKSAKKFRCVIAPISQKMSDRVPATQSSWCSLDTSDNFLAPSGRRTHHGSLSVACVCVCGDSNQQPCSHVSDH